MIKAAIDIGTNTAHLLIGKVEEGAIKQIVFKKRFYTFLGDDGLEKISAVAVERLMEALDQFKMDLDDALCECVQVIATEGLRAASNGDSIYSNIQTKYGWPISIISGSEESDLIFAGVQQAFDTTAGNHLIMDIGGGSVEFIVTEDGLKSFSKSYPIGISRLYQQFHQDEQKESLDLASMMSFLDDQLKNLWEFLDSSDKRYELIGCSGTFEIFLNKEIIANNEVASTVVEITKMRDLLGEVREKNLEERTIVKDLPKERAKYIVVALALIDYTINKLNISTIRVCKYALKEGVLVNDF